MAGLNWNVRPVRSALLLAQTVGLIALASCGPNDDIAGETTCNGAVARATYTWQADYYPSRTDRDRRQQERVETFGQAELITRNGTKPVDAVSGPDDEGIWWPQQPPRPSADELDRRRQNFEDNDGPKLVQKRDFFLECEIGNLSANGRVYRQVARALQDEQFVVVNHSLGRALQAKVFSTGGGAQVSEPSSQPAANPAQPESGSTGVNDNSQSAVPSPVTLYVNANGGNDEAVGTAEAPFRTISRAIAQAAAGDTIQLRPGNYSVEGGEQFPLELASGVTLLGDEATKGNGVQIVGGGDYVSPTWAKQSVAIVVADGAQLRGVTVANPNVRGTGVWVESGSPLLTSNTFINCHREGVFVSGGGTPEVRQNLFESNGGNGISFTRDSGGIAEGNVFRSNGYGIAVSDRAAPLLVANEVSYGRFGMVISGESRPILRENQISNQAEDGVIVVNAASPTLENNLLSQNGKQNINNQSSSRFTVEAAELVRGNSVQ